jgi:hypothetical protein
VNPAESARFLQNRLRSAGIDLEQPSAAAVVPTWKTFQDFSAVPVEGVLGPDEDGDGVLVQYGVYDFGGDSGRHFALDFTRQFIGEGISQLHCTIEYAVLPELEAMAERSVWSFGLTRDEFAARVEQLEGFRWALAAGVTPRRLVVAFDGDVC